MAIRARSPWSVRARWRLRPRRGSERPKLAAEHLPAPSSGAATGIDGGCLARSDGEIAIAPRLRSSPWRKQERRGPQGVPAARPGLEPGLPRFSAVGGPVRSYAPWPVGTSFGTLLTSVARSRSCGGWASRMRSGPFAASSSDGETRTRTGPDGVPGHGHGCRHRELMARPGLEPGTPHDFQGLAFLRGCQRKTCNKHIRGR